MVKFVRLLANQLFLRSVFCLLALLLGEQEGFSEKGLSTPMDDQLNPSDYISGQRL